MSDCHEIMANDSRKKIVLVGDEKCGKIGLIFNYFSGALPNPAEPQIYKDYLTEIEVDGQTIPIVLWIVPAQEHYSAIRTLSYDDSKAVILCYAIDNPTSLRNACEKWYPEIKKYIPNAPIVLVGNKMDLRSDENTINELASKSLKPVSFEQGKEAAEKIKAVKYIECSAKNGDAVKEVFKTAAAASLQGCKETK
ncbi:ras-like GTP-binding protein Rho1 [Trichonephila clavata]|uniref:Ras-like GTP-binding protein Rho1 n=1 Tax=Trichonephila clavata TaxID=2740835 RepID=A0A8X6HZ22_TRICU|nr:ras-like GTP-binding protein Rho1 [Trichonephila clavata]